MSFYVRYSGPRVKTSNEHLYVNFWSVRNAACKVGAQPLHWRTDYDSRAECAQLQGRQKVQGCGGSRVAVRQKHRRVGVRFSGAAARSICLYLDLQM